jgi:hypothetical protein
MDALTAAPIIGLAILISPVPVSGDLGSPSVIPMVLKILVPSTAKRIFPN